MKTFADFRIELPGGASGEVDVLCPECSHTRKKKRARCLGVNVEKGTWLCQHCGWAGGLGTGARRHEELHWRKPVYVRYEAKPVADDLDVGMVQFFATRSIPAPVLRRNRISAQRVYMPQAEDHVKAICFPYYRGEEFINAKYRDREKNFRMEAGAERILYGLNDIDLARVVIVEGEIDKLSVEVAGITSCVSVPDGAPAVNAKNYDSKFTFLDADADQLAGVKEWIIAVDSDEPGSRLEQELSRRLGIGKCKRVRWPEGCKDANEVLIKYGPDLLKELIDHAEEFPIDGVIWGEQFKRDIEVLYSQGDQRGLSTGWPKLDEHFTLQRGEVTVITGTPGSGKSNWLDDLLVNLAKLHDWRTPIFSPENTPVSKHMSRLMTKFIKQPFRDGPTPRMTPASRDSALECCSYYFPMILPKEEEDWTLANILEIAESLLLRYGIKALVIDPWNELEGQRPASMTETQFIGKCLKKVRHFARRTGIHVFIVAHPAKLQRNRQDGKYPMPSLYDISDSAHWYNKIDNGIVVYRDKSDPAAPVEVHVQKIRLPETGDVGQVNFKYNKALANYEEYAVRDAWSAQA
jgi:twinkle protein